jgi:hypothetical protein
MNFTVYFCGGCLMPWKHFTVMFKRNVSVSYSNEIFSCEISIGRVYTGRSRVFVGYFCKAEINEISISHEDHGSLYVSFLQSMRELIKLGYCVNVYGLQRTYRESGLSSDSGYGYVPELSGKPFLMIDELPPSGNGIDDFNNDSD